MKEVGREVRLDRQSFCQELLVEVLPSLLTHEYAATAFFLLRPTSATYHLQNVHNGIVDISMFLPLVVLNSRDDDHVT